MNLEEVLKVQSKFKILFLCSPPHQTQVARLRLSQVFFIYIALFFTIKIVSKQRYSRDPQILV